MKDKILIIEDEPGLIFMLKDSLELEGYEVLTAEDGRTGIDITLEQQPDLILLDIMLPEYNGWDVCRILRNKGSEIPIIMLTVKNQESDKVLGFKLGADDYVTKPFSMIELLSRIEARLRRVKTSKQSDEVCTFGDVRIDFKHFQAYKNNQPIKLSTREFRIMEFFIQNKGKLITRDQLLNAVWDYDSSPYSRTVDMHICKLRQKIEDDPQHPKYLITIHWAGYKFLG
jgi:DNA-binding response OmpR family regulator